MDDRAKSSPSDESARSGDEDFARDISNELNMYHHICWAYEDSHVYLDLTAVTISFILAVKWPTIIDADVCEWTRFRHSSLRKITHYVIHR